MFSVATEPTVVETYTGEDGREYLRPVRWDAGLVEMVPSFGHPADESEAWEQHDYDLAYERERDDAGC